MKRFNWINLLLALVFIYFLLLAFSSIFLLVFNLSLILAILFIYFGIRHQSIVLFFIGLAFAFVYLNRFGMAPVHYHSIWLFIAIIALGLLIANVTKNPFRWLSYFKSEREGKNPFSHVRALFTRSRFTISDRIDEKMTVDSLFSSVTIDLSQASFMTDQPVIVINSLFSTIHLILPKDYTYANHLTSILADVKLQKQREQGPVNTITITGNHILGRLKITDI